MKKILVTLLFALSVIMPLSARAVVPPGGAAPYFGQCLPNYITNTDFFVRPLNALPEKSPKFQRQFIATLGNGTYKLDVTVWRENCANSAYPATVMRIFTSGFGSRLSSINADEIKVTQGSNTATLSNVYICSGLANCTSSSARLSSSTFDDSTNTLLLAKLTNETIDLAKAFTLTIAGSGGTLDVPAFGFTGPISFTGQLSGLWNDPARGGEGFMFDIGTVGTRNVFFVAWFTHNQLRQRWIAGSGDFAEGASSITLPMVTVEGTNFGNQFNAAMLQNTPWGTATFKFNNCNSLTVTYSGGGEQATRNFVRGVGNLKGASCN